MSGITRKLSPVSSHELISVAPGLQTPRLTANSVIAASRCKQYYLYSQKTDYCVNWGGLWGDSHHDPSGPIFRKAVPLPVGRNGTGGDESGANTHPLL
jgi:hypothetical protein